MNNGIVQWGILGAAEIARKNWKAIRLSGNGTVAAVASRNLDRAQQFISECQRNEPVYPAPRPFGRYEELIAAPEIDAIYIPVPTGIRGEWVLRAAEAGKHIVCEKPCAANSAELQCMIDACRKNKVQFMDGVMFMHSRRLAEMRSVLDDSRNIGDIQRITSAFSFFAGADFYESNIRARAELEPFGSLGDLGWYCIRFALWAMRGAMPHTVSGRILSEFKAPGSSAPVPTTFSGELFFENSVSSSFYCSFNTANEQWAQISGTAGYLRLSDFVLPFFGDTARFDLCRADQIVSGCDFNMEARWKTISVPEYSNSHPSAQESNLFRNFAAQILSGTLNSDWPAQALKTQQIMEGCLASARAGSRETSIA